MWQPSPARCTPGGRLFLAVLLDRYAWLVDGWAISAVNDRHLVMKALGAALRHRQPDDRLLHHTHQGSPHPSEDYQRILRARGVTCSMSRRGNCYGNVAMESSFSMRKAELGERFDHHAEAKAKLFGYIAVFCNHQRRHSSLGYIGPVEFESRAAGQSIPA